MLKAVQRQPFKAILRTSNCLIDKAARNRLPRGRHIEVQPQARQLLQVVAPPSTDTHAVEYVVKSGVLEDHLADLDWQDGEWVGGFGGRELACELIVKLLEDLQCVNVALLLQSEGRQAVVNSP